MYTIFLKEYQDALPEDKGSIVLATSHDIVKLLTMYGGQNLDCLYTT